MSEWIKYLIVTIALPAIGIFIIGITFAYMFTDGRGASTLQKSIVVSSLISPFVLAYFAVKLLNIIWWYPAILIAAPAILWFIVEMFSPSAYPYILLLPISVILVFALGAGKLGYMHRQSKHA